MLGKGAKAAIWTFSALVLSAATFAIGYEVGLHKPEQKPAVRDPLKDNVSLQSAACDGEDLQVVAYIRQGFELNGRPNYLCFNPLICATVHNHAGVVKDPVGCRGGPHRKGLQGKDAA